MFTLPSGVLEYKDGAVGSAIIAVVLVHCVIAAYVYMAWIEGATPAKPSPIKTD